MISISSRTAQILIRYYSQYVITCRYHFCLTYMYASTLWNPTFFLMVYERRRFPILYRLTEKSLARLRGGVSWHGSSLFAYETKVAVHIDFYLLFCCGFEIVTVLITRKRKRLIIFVYFMTTCIYFVQ